METASTSIMTDRQMASMAGAISSSRDIVPQLSTAPLPTGASPKGGRSAMTFEFNPAEEAMIGAHQDCLLSARPR